LKQGGVEAKLPLVPLRGHEFKEAAGNTMYVTSTKKNILHKLSGILRGHGSAEFLQKFDDNLYVHISDAMDELKRQLPHEKSLAQNWSVRTWLGIVANDEKCRYSVLAVSGLHNADAINIQSCPIKISAAQGSSSHSHGRQESYTTFGKLVYCREDHRHFYEHDLVQHGNTCMPMRVYHLTNRKAADLIVKYGVIPEGAGGSESGRKHAFFSSIRVGHKGYVSGMRADAPIEIAVDMVKAVEAGVNFIL